MEPAQSPRLLRYVREKPTSLLFQLCYLGLLGRQPDLIVTDTGAVIIPILHMTKLFDPRQPHSACVHCVQNC